MNYSVFIAFQFVFSLHPLGPPRLREARPDAGAPTAPELAHRAVGHPDANAANPREHPDANADRPREHADAELGAGPGRPGVEALVERFDIEPFSDFSAK